MNSFWREKNVSWSLELVIEFFCYQLWVLEELTQHVWSPTELEKKAVASLKKISPKVFPFWTLAGTASIGATCIQSLWENNNF
jgi:hypothetical protein